MTPPYELTCADRGGTAYPVERFDSLEDALRARDERRQRTDPYSVHYFVIDADDAERGDAEWCGEGCERGAFTYACEECR